MEKYPRGKERGREGEKEAGREGGRVNGPVLKGVQTEKQWQTGLEFGN